MYPGATGGLELGVGGARQFHDIFGSRAGTLETTIEDHNHHICRFVLGHLQNISVAAELPKRVALA